MCRVHIKHVTYSYLRRDVFMCVTGCIHICDMAHSNAAFICVTCLIHAECTRRSMTLQHAATHCNTLQHTATRYGMASISRLLNIIGLFGKRDLYNRRYSAKETYNFKEPTNRSHPIPHAAKCCNMLQHAAIQCNTVV